MLRRDNYTLGAILGFLGPIIGLLIFKFTKFAEISFSDTLRYFYQEQGHRTISVALSLALLVNAVLFTFYINSRKDKTAKGIFIFTCIYGLAILIIKTIN